jgi:hypothetical protein
MRISSRFFPGAVMNSGPMQQVQHQSAHADDFSQENRIGVFFQNRSGLGWSSRTALFGDLLAGAAR